MSEGDSVPEAPIAAIADAVKRFVTPEGGTVAALDGVTLEISKREFVTLLGPSGCGKTTLLRAISGFENLDEGEVRIGGEVMTDVPPHQRPVNTVFQNYALFPHLSVEGNVAYGLEVTGVPKRERVVRVGEALEMVGLSGYEKRRPDQLSGGQRQRVALSRAIVNRPSLLLLDEPLSALDRNLRQSMQLELKTLQHDLGICFLFVTHDQEEALTMSDRVVVLNQGRIEQSGTPEALYHRPSTRFVAAFIGDGSLFYGTIQGPSNDPHLQTEDGLRFRLAPGAPVGERTTLLLRPEHLELVPKDSGDGKGAIDARLEQSIFLGASRQLVCKLANGATVTAAPAGLGEKESDLVDGQAIQLAYRLDRPYLIPEPAHGG
ncbi:MAG: ABC transporter ATP-binding protein [Pseudomonadota bacterium]